MDKGSSISHLANTPATAAGTELKQQVSNNGSASSQASKIRNFSATGLAGETGSKAIDDSAFKEINVQDDDLANVREDDEPSKVNMVSSSILKAS